MEHPISKELREIAAVIDRDSLVIAKTAIFLELLSLDKIADPVQAAETLLDELNQLQSAKPILKKE